MLVIASVLIAREFFSRAWTVRVPVLAVPGGRCGMGNKPPIPLVALKPDCPEKPCGAPKAPARAIGGYGGIPPHTAAEPPQRGILRLLRGPPQPPHADRRRTAASLTFQWLMGAAVRRPTATDPPKHVRRSFEGQNSLPFSSLSTLPARTILRRSSPFRPYGTSSTLRSLNRRSIALTKSASLKPWCLSRGMRAKMRGA